MQATAPELIGLLCDPGSFESWDEPVETGHHDAGYRAALLRAAERSGLDEAVLTGVGRVSGRRVVLVIGDFRFLGGSIGRASADRIIRAIGRATQEGLPILASTASGGTRMQEGTPAFLAMTEITRVVLRHKAARLPYLVHLRHPTTGGVYASWGSLGHITVAEPAALVGFLGPKVYEALNGQPFPTGVQVSDHLYAHGVIDEIVPAHELQGWLERVLAVLLDAPTGHAASPAPVSATGEIDAWSAVLGTREPDRIGAADLLEQCGELTTRLHGTGEGQRGAGIISALTRLAGQPCVYIGQDRNEQADRPMGAAALREARRAMRLAEDLGLPVVTVIDTPGAELSRQAEESAIAGEIARCLATMLALPVPTVAVLLGQGCGGGALALLAANKVIATDHAWLSPLPLEGASVILHGDTSHAAAMARAQHIRALDLFRAGTVDLVVAEPADGDIGDLARALATEVAHSITVLRA